MTALELVQAVETSGGILAVNGNKLRCSIPREAAHLIDALRTQKPEVITILRRRDVSGLPWPEYNNGRQFCCGHCLTRFDTSVGIAKHRFNGCAPERSATPLPVRDLPSCPTCGSFALYREKDGRTSCQTCNA